MKIKNNIYTVELSKVYSVFNVLDDQPCDLIKLHGVFFDTFEQFSKGHFIDGILTAIFVDSDYPFVTDTRAPSERFRYFVKKKDLEFTPTPVSPQIYRPFKDTKEFLEFILCDNRDWEGYSFGIRRKSDKKEFDICICGRNDQEIILPAFGVVSMEYCFNHFEIKFLNENLKYSYIPFGIKKNDTK